MSQLALVWGPLVMQERGGVKNHGHLPATVGWGQELDTTMVGCRVVMLPSCPRMGPHSSLQFGPLCILLGG